MTEQHHPLTPTQLLSYMRAQPWAIEASVTPDGAPQAAVIGVAITDRWELLFDTVTQSRKHQNLVKNPRVAFVIGWEHERTVQYEGDRRDSLGSGSARGTGPLFRSLPGWPSPRQAQLSPGPA